MIGLGSDKNRRPSKVRQKEIFNMVSDNKCMWHRNPRNHLSLCFCVHIVHSLLTQSTTSYINAKWGQNDESRTHNISKSALHKLSSSLYIMSTIHDPSPVVGLKGILSHTVSWLNSSVTLLVSKAPLNRTVKNGCFWVDPPLRFTAQNSGGH